VFEPFSNTSVFEPYSNTSVFPTNSAIHDKLLLIRSVSYSRHEALIYIMF
jgi:hypothetical protein